MARKKLNRERINVTIAKPVLSDVDEYAATKGDTRSDVLQNAAVEYLSKRGALQKAAENIKPKK